MSNDFDWNKSESVLFPSVGAVAVYQNPAGDVVIRQQADALEEDDHVVVVPRAMLQNVIDALTRIQRED